MAIKIRRRGLSSVSHLCVMVLLMGQFIVYLLHHETSAHAYVGKSTKGIRRPQMHGSPSNLRNHPTFPVVRWIKKLHAKGLNYEIAILEESTNAAALVEAEQFYIAYFRSIGLPLLNCTDGGEGSIGYRHADEARRRMSELKSGWRPSPEHIARSSQRWTGSGNPKFGKTISSEQKKLISEANKGRHPSETTRAKMSMSHLGKKRTTPRPPVTDETRTKLSVAAKGRQHRLESRVKMSESRRLVWQRSLACKVAIVERNKRRGEVLRRRIQEKLIAFVATADPTQCTKQGFRKYVSPSHRVLGELVSKLIEDGVFVCIDGHFQLRNA